MSIKIRFCEDTIKDIISNPVQFMRYLGLLRDKAKGEVAITYYQTADSSE